MVNEVEATTNSPLASVLADLRRDTTFAFELVRKLEDRLQWVLLLPGEEIQGKPRLGIDSAPAICEIVDIRGVAKETTDTLESILKRLVV